MTDLGFWIGGLVAVTAGLMAVTRRNAVASVLWLVVTFIAMSVLFLSMNAGFIAAIQVLVYTGAIMVLFLFVIMLLRLSPSGLARMDRPRTTLLGIAAAAGVVGLLCAATLSSTAWREGGTEAAIAAREAGRLVQGDTLPLANQLFTRHLLPFEVTSVLLLVAIVGAVALTKRKV